MSFKFRIRNGTSGTIQRLCMFVGSEICQGRLNCQLHCILQHLVFSFLCTHMLQFHLLLDCRWSHYTLKEQTSMHAAVLGFGLLPLSVPFELSCFRSARIQMTQVDFITSSRFLLSRIAELCTSVNTLHSSAPYSGESTDVRNRSTFLSPICVSTNRLQPSHVRVVLQAISSTTGASVAEYQV